MLHRLLLLLKVVFFVHNLHFAIWKNSCQNLLWHEISSNWNVSLWITTELQHHYANTHRSHKLTDWKQIANVVHQIFILRKSKQIFAIFFGKSCEILLHESPMIPESDFSHILAVYLTSIDPVRSCRHQNAWMTHASRVAKFLWSLRPSLTWYKRFDHNGNSEKINCWFKQASSWLFLQQEANKPIIFARLTDRCCTKNIGICKNVLGSIKMQSDHHFFR